MLNNMIEIKMRNKRFEVKEGTSVYDILRDGNKNVLAVKNRYKNIIRIIGNHKLEYRKASGNIGTELFYLPESILP